MNPDMTRYARQMIFPPIGEEGQRAARSPCDRHRRRRYRLGPGRRIARAGVGLCG